MFAPTGPPDALNTISTRDGPAELVLIALHLQPPSIGMSKSMFDTLNVKKTAKMTTKKKLCAQGHHVCTSKPF